MYDGNNLNIITDIYNEIGNLPADFTLYQNFPNPFNPTTKIKFTIPNVETTRRVVSTTLKIYDVLGNEVATLLNEEKPAGEYEIEFDAKKNTIFQMELISIKLLLVLLH